MYHRPQLQSPVLYEQSNSPWPKDTECLKRKELKKILANVWHFCLKRWLFCCQIKSTVFFQGFISDDSFDPIALSEVLVHMHTCKKTIRYQVTFRDGQDISLSKVKWSWGNHIFRIPYLPNYINPVSHLNDI